MGTALPGVDGTAFIQDAVKIADNEVQAGSLSSTEQLGIGAFTVTDDTDRKSRSGGETIQLGTGAQTVIGSSGDTLIGGNSSDGRQVIDATGRNHEVTGGPETVIGGAGALLVKAGVGDSIVGGSGPETIQGGGKPSHGGDGHGEDGEDGRRRNGDGRLADDDQGNNGGDENDGHKPGAVGHDTIVGGSGPMTVSGAPGDSIIGGMGTLLVDIFSQSHGSTVTGGGQETVALGNGHGATTLRDESVSGGHGPLAQTTVTGFSTLSDVIASQTSVDNSGKFLGTSTTSGSNTILTFKDGSSITLVGITDISKVMFTK